MNADPTGAVSDETPEPAITPAQAPRGRYTPAERLAIALGTVSPEDLGDVVVNLPESDPELPQSS